MLEQYRSKRDFANTPEPQGKKTKKRKKILSFFIQKHTARHLHYDLRLEVFGVLKSWAVPKEITMETGTRHLAIMVEDHPLEYGNFEGIIPKGNYGAGTVEVWDKGIYVPVNQQGEAQDEDFANKSIKEGKLNFHLEGKKLKGGFTLIKFKGDKNEWLLLKTKHNLNEPIVKMKTESNRTLNNKFGFDLSSTPKAGMPEKIEPMLATLIDKPFDKKDWIYEIKWDGYRVIARIDNKKIKLLSRRGLSLNERFSPISRELTRLESNAIIDGEAVVIDNQGRSDFQKLQNFMRTGIGKLVFYVFDILYLNGHDLKKMPLENRREILKNILPKSKIIKFSDSIDGEGIKFFNEALKLGLEGIMAKSKGGVYEPGKRGKDWLKVKIKNYQETIICGYIDPKGGRKYFGSLILGVYQNNKLVYIGNMGTGFSEKLLKETWAKMKNIKRDSSPFSPTPKLKEKAHWVEPILVCEVAFREWTSDGLLRQPVFYRWRDDKKANDVVKEIPEPVIETIGDPSTRLRVKEMRTIVGDKKIKFTNLNKIFWPDSGETKGDVIQYYEKIADVILPYLKGRPESMNRHPNGIMGESFYQKNIIYRPPKWANTKKIYSKSNEKNITYLICDNKITLLYMANLGCIEINPWHSRIDGLDRPDYAILDLDPNNVGIDEAVRTALEAKKLFDELKVKSYIKTSGGRGLHIYIPMCAKYSYDQVVPFMKLIAIEIHKRIPKITSLERSVKKKQGCIYLDYLQNNKAQTIASVYSLRPKPGATVSTPLFWEEIKKGLDPLNYNMHTIFNRIEKYGDIWKNLLKEKTDLEKVLKKLDKIIE